MLTREPYRLLGPESVSGGTPPGVGSHVLCTTPAPDSTLPSLALYMYANSRSTHCELHDKSPVREVLCLMTTVTNAAADTAPAAAFLAPGPDPPRPPHPIGSCTTRQAHSMLTVRAQPAAMEEAGSEGTASIRSACSAMCCAAATRQCSRCTPWQCESTMACCVAAVLARQPICKPHPCCSLRPLLRSQGGSGC